MVNSPELPGTAMSPVSLILISLVFTSAMLALIFYLAWRTGGRQPHPLSWSITFALATVQWIFNLMHDRFPSPEFHWILVNTIGLLAISFAVLGHCQRVARPVAPHLLWGLPSAALLVITWFTVVQPHVGIRMAVGPIYSSLALLFCAWCILSADSKRTVAEWGAAATLGFFAVTQFAAGTVALLQGPTVNQAYLDAYLMINFVAMPAAFTGMGMFVVFMLASDLSNELKEQAVRDGLTGLLNRRGFGESAGLAYASARRSDRPISVIMTDIDRFKSINDEFGHTVGDQALIHFAKLLRNDRRAEDILARVGGEEFALVLPGTSLETGIRIAEQLCKRLEHSALHTDKGVLQMTASFGVAALSTRDTCLSDVVVRADTALYRSKKGGRNRVDLESSQKFMKRSGVFRPIRA